MKTKRFLTLFVLSSIFYFSFSQTPQGFNYQAIARDASGNPIVNTTLQVKLAILGDLTGSTIYWEELFPTVQTNAFGLFTVIAGTGARQATSTVGSFSAINWNIVPLYLRTQIYYQNDWKNMGTTQLWSVPYALRANNVTGSQPYMNITGSTQVMDSALFVVRNNKGQIVFAVYNEGVRIYVDDGLAKSTNKGGFAIGGFGTAKGPSQEYFRVTRDSTRVYVNQLAKGVKGGFAIGGFSPAKGIDTTSFMSLTPTNYFIGYGAGNVNNPGLYNSFMGYHAGLNNTGSFNTFIGFKTGNTNTTGSQNIFLGYQAGYSNDTSSFNIFIGNQAGSGNIRGNFNTYLGYQSGQYNPAGTYNTYIGYQTGQLSQGNANIYIGQQAGSKITIGTSNVFMGALSGQNKASGSRNLFLGTGSGMNSTTGNDNIFLGTASGLKTTSDFNIFIGNYSGYNNTTGIYNVFAGGFSGANNTKGSSNIYFGLTAGYADSVGSYNIYQGEGAGYNSQGSNNIMFGYHSGYSGVNGNYNVFMGRETGMSNVGDKNMFIGFQAGYMHSAGNDNIYLGNQSGYNATAGAWNVGIGTQTGNNTTGNSNIFIGYQAGYYNTSGMQNVFQGTQAGFFNKTGYNNIFIGVAAGQNNTDGFDNVFLGMQTGNKNTTGSFNTSIGYLAGFSNVLGSSNVFIGNMAGYNETGSNRLYISNTTGDKNNALVYGEFDLKNLTFNANVGIGKTSPGTKLDITSGNWDVQYGEGDFRIGDGNYRFKIGVANAGGGAGDVRMNAHGGTNRLILGGGGKDILLVTNANVMPWTDNYSTLGASTNRWTAVYAVNGVIQTSDIRMKTNIKAIPYGLESIMKLEPVTFNWKSNTDNRTRIGLIAQDVEKVINEVVEKGLDPEHTLGINYSELVPVLIKGMQEQQQQIESAVNENKDLKNQLKALWEEIEQLKTQVRAQQNK